MVFMMAAKEKAVSSLLRDEYGLTTVGMVIALLLSVSLMFSAGQVYRVNSTSAEMQSVADTAALAAQNQVAEFMVVVRVCDAVVLSLSLTGIVATGLGTAALCTPVTAPSAQTLLDIAQRVFKARDSFAEKATKGLNALQKTLPFLATVKAASVAQANNKMGSDYLALAVLVPDKGNEIAIADDTIAEKSLSEVQNNSDEISNMVSEAERMAKEANKAKKEAFIRDCGDNPSYCMYERAETLASLSGSENPLYNSIDTWSFSVALKRAQTYYQYRLINEAPEGSSVEDSARSALRKRFYVYALNHVKSGYVKETADTFDALFPRLPRNTAEMRKTSLYTEVVYPCTSRGNSKVMHAWDGCPEVGQVVSRESIAHMEKNSYRLCEQCKFTAASLGKVAAASTSIENGFEFHYDAVATAAEKYQQARSELDPLSADLKEAVSPLFEDLGKALKQVASCRIDAQPPGSSGVIVLALNMGRALASQGFENTFISNSGVLGMRAAVSSATLLAEPSEEGKSVITSLLDGFASKAGTSTGITGMVLQCWSQLLHVYAEGQSVLKRALSSAFDFISLESASGLGSWAAETFSTIVESVGLEPVSLDSLKAVLVNSAHVAKTDKGAFSARFLEIKTRAIQARDSQESLFTSLAGFVGQSFADMLFSSEEKIQIAVIEVVGPNGPSIPIEISLPNAVKETPLSAIQNIIDKITYVCGKVVGARVWG